jgi:hypothetical protein
VEITVFLQADTTAFLHAGITASFTAGASLAFRRQSCHRRPNPRRVFPAFLNAANQDAKDKLISNCGIVTAQAATSRGLSRTRFCAVSSSPLAAFRFALAMLILPLFAFRF